MIIMAVAAGVARRVRYRHRETMCRYLGCGRVATRLAYDRLYNRIPACADPDHGKEIPK